MLGRLFSLLLFAEGMALAITFEGLPTGNLTAESPKMIAYLENWESTPPPAVLAHYTHIIYSFIETEGSSCKLNGPSAADVEKVRKGSSAKIMASLGGASMNKYWKDCSVETLISQTAAFVASAGLDGVDIDYEIEPAQHDFVVALSNGLRAAMPRPRLLSHAPQSPDMVRNGSYWNALLDSHGVDFVNVQYYNNDPNPLSDPAGSIKHYEAVVKELFGGDASKVVFGFCIADCGAQNADASVAAAFTSKLKAATGGRLGGVFAWAVNQGDGDGHWSAAVLRALRG